MGERLAQEALDFQRVPDRADDDGVAHGLGIGHVLGLSPYFRRSATGQVIILLGDTLEIGPLCLR